ncbi:MAG: glycosyltransferase family 2 protein [Vulcanimicrobiota bacterium]
MKGKKTGIPFMVIATIFAIGFSLVYASVRMVLLLGSEYLWIEKIIAYLLLFAEFFIIMNGIGYFLEIYRVNLDKARKSTEEEDLKLDSPPPVAVVVASYREPPEVLQDTLTAFYNLSYPNTRLVLLDDTRYDLPNLDKAAMQAYREKIDALAASLKVSIFRRRWHGAKAGIINDFLEFLKNTPREGSSLIDNSDGKSVMDTEYMAIFDADMNPFPGFLDPLVGKMERNPRLAFIQTPQYYTNFEKNRVARASGLQQAVFYEFICEGKSLQDAMFCCGTNVLFRIDALNDVGGFDDTSVTEDFATSLKFHMKGWSSLYHGKVSTFGMGPEDLGGYFKQQYRWAHGTLGLFWKVLAEFLKNPAKLSLLKWWEYFLSSTYYCVGIVFLIMNICPIIYLFFDVPSYFAKPEVYLSFYVPYFTVTMLLFLLTMSARNYKLKEIIQGQVLIAITFPVFIRAAFAALFGIKSSFVVTTKGQSQSLPLSELWLQLLLGTICFAAAVWGVNRVVYEPENTWAILVNIFWCLYSFPIMASVLYFNNPVET